MRLLLVEDDQPLAEGLVKDLTKHGYATDWVANGIDAQFMGEQEPYDVIVLDLGLPQRSGLDVLAHWRAASLSTPVLILTARNAWHEKVEGFRAGADDYLAKPFHIEELKARIDALVRRSKGRAGATLAVNGLKLNEERQLAILPDESEVALTGVEFRLLRYMMNHPDHVLSKSQLLEHVYDYDSEKDSNVIEVYIRHLRKKLGNDIIETRRGQGYVFRSVNA